MFRNRLDILGHDDNLALLLQKLNDLENGVHQISKRLTELEVASRQDVRRQPTTDYTHQDSEPVPPRRELEPIAQQGESADPQPRLPDTYELTPPTSVAAQAEVEVHKPVTEHRPNLQSNLVRRPGGAAVSATHCAVRSHQTSAHRNSPYAFGHQLVPQFKSPPAHGAHQAQAAGQQAQSPSGGPTSSSYGVGK
jgi:hypothetical protein